MRKIFGFIMLLFGINLLAEHTAQDDWFMREPKIPEDTTEVTSSEEYYVQLRAYKKQIYLVCWMVWHNLV